MASYKLSELVLGMKGAKNSFAALEDLTDEELQALHEECRSRAQATHDHLEERRDAKPESKRAAAKARRPRHAAK